MKIKNGCAGCPECEPEKYGKSSVVSSGYAIPADAEENLLLDTLARIRITTGLIKPMLTELPGEVRILMNELRELRSVTHRALELYERWELEHDPDTCQFAEWDALKEALKSAGALPA
jgi:hypothetical protein